MPLIDSLAPLMKSERVDWNTPEQVLTLVRRLGPITLDPCSNAGSIVGARVAWELERDGDSLAKSWRLGGLVYVNPPYGRAIVPFMDKMRDEANLGAEIVALVPARTDTRWFQMTMGAARAVCLWKGRITFLGAPDPAPFPSAIFYYGPRSVHFTDVFRAVGSAFLL